MKNWLTSHLYQAIMTALVKLRIDKERYEAFLGRTRLKLTSFQIDILEVIVKADGKIVTRDDLMKIVWGWDKEVRSSVKTRTIDQHISRIRNAINSKTEIIRTVREQGYSLSHEVR